MQYNCPVCNKAGLQNYTATPTVCPQCNSDLKPFLLLNSIAKPNSNKIFLLGIIGVAFLAIVFVALYFNSLSESKKLSRDNSKSIIQLIDSIHNLQTANAKPLTTEIKSSEMEIVIQYKVKKDDYPSKIAQFFYNDWRMYKKIEADNGLHQPYVLKVGQTLIIKLKQQ